MKKLCSLILALCLIFSLSACRKDNSVQDTGSSTTQSQTNANDTSSTEQNIDTSSFTTDNSDVSSDIDTPNSTASTTEHETSKPTTTTTPETLEPSTSTHIHSFSTATCTEAAKCSCGATNGNALGHNYNNGVCSICGGKDENYVKTYSIGETWIIDGQWEFTVNSVTTHSLCNAVANENDGYIDEQVVIIDYTYKNIGYEEDLLITISHFKVYDETGKSGRLYACTHTKSAGMCRLGKDCTAQEDYILFNNSSEIILSVSHRTTNGLGVMNATFYLNVN